MVKMAHAPLRKLICTPLNTPSMCPTDFTATTALSDVLKSDPVKRLFNQPNIVIKTIPLKPPETSASNNNIVINKTDNLCTATNELRQPEMCLVPLRMGIEDNNEDENLLPSKREGKSEIALVPIKREKKPCGHYEPCENIVCDVAVQQYVDRDSASPMLATSIEEDEINAPVSKHCTNEKCDALSIDHDRCRRAVIRLNRCNRSSACDICGIMLKSQRSRVSHKNCTRKNEYRHNEVDGAQILKERMREREIQIMEALKTKKNNYLDPVTGNNLAMETLKNNEELIIIPKSVPMQQATVNMTSLASAQSTQSIHCTQQQATNVNNIFRNILPNIPIVLPQQSIVIGKTSCSNENNVTAPVQVALPDTLNRSLITPSSAVSLPQNQYLTFATQHNAQSITINDLLFTQSQFMTTPIQTKPLLTPIRVVPITNLITQPSLLHQTQGIPKFCIMADNTVAPPITVSNPPVQPVQAVQQSVLVPKVSVPQNCGVVSNVKPLPQRKRKTSIRKKRKLKRKDFKCDYCLKRFSTDWYFKIHVAKHTGEKQFSCKMCTQSFTNRYDMKRHMANTHKDETILSGKQNQQATEQSCKCLNCNIDCTSLDDLKHHRQKCHGVTECTLCHTEISLEELDRHMVSVHKEHENMKMKEVTEDSDNSDDTNKLVLSNSIKTKLNNCDLQQEDNANKMNGCVSIPNQIAAEDVEAELEY